MSRQRAVVVCPGRGTYNRAELGYLTRYHNHQQALWQEFDQARTAAGLPGLLELDQRSQFSGREHLRAENAAPLIYGCAYGDFQAIDPEHYEVVAVTGNSMGWYIALACAGAVNANQGLQLVTDMAQMTSGKELGGQLIYPLTNADWTPSPERQHDVERVLAAHQGALFLSIAFGGYAVLAGTDKALKAALRELPTVDDRYPFQLPGHSAFHTPILEPQSQQAQQHFPADFFQAPAVPLIDGRGHIWETVGTEPAALHAYTLGHQVTQPYNFSAALTVAVKEFAPDVLILTGPGATMGGAVAQALIAENWWGLSHKNAFIERQAEDPKVLAMGMPEQRKLVIPGQGGSST